MGAGYSADILCTVTLEARQERRDQGSLSNFLYSRYIIVFRTSKVVSTKPSLFHLHCRYFVVMKPLRRHVRKTTVSCDWRRPGHVTIMLTSDWSGAAVHRAGAGRVAAALPAHHPLLQDREVSCDWWNRNAHLWLVEPQYSPLIGGATLTSDWSGRPTTDTSATCTGPTATPGTPSWTSCESCSISWIVWCYDIHMPFVQIRTSEEF